MSIRKRISIIILVLFMVFGQFTVSAEEKAEIVKSYYLLKYEYAGFLEPLQKVGVRDTQLVEFFKDVEFLLNNYENLSKENIEVYLKNALFTAATYSENFDVAIAILNCYEAEFAEYSSTGKIPGRLQDVYNAVVDAIFRDDLPEKVNLI